jgi:hypothetical protein
LVAVKLLREELLKGTQKNRRFHSQEVSLLPGFQTNLDFGESEMNHASLEKWNYHVISGDVLLLTSRGVEATAIKAYQSRKRGAPAHYTHVAIVIDRDLVVEAIPKKGVVFTPWESLEGEYDIERCRVARHAILASSVDTPARVYRRAVYYFSQRYSLRALTLQRRCLTDQEGVVCSQFVELLLDDLHANSSLKPPLETLPIDIDLGTQESPDWRQFPLSEYGLYSKSVVPVAHEYREDRERGLMTTLSPEQAEEARRFAGDILKSGNIEKLSASNADSNVAISDLDPMRRSFVDRVPKMLETQYQVSLSSQQLDDLVLKIAATVGEWSSNERRRFAAQFGLGGAALSGSRTLSLWKALFEAEPEEVVFLHEERGRINLDAHRKLLRNNLRDSRMFVLYILASYGDLVAHIDWIRQLASHNSLSLDLVQVQQFRKVADAIAASGKCFVSEPVEEIEARTDVYPSLFAHLTVRVLSGGDLELLEDARNCLQAIEQLDFDRLHWARIMQPKLMSIINLLESLQVSFVQ